MKRILSGVRPTGAIHLGNYLGAIRNWVKLQHQSEENLFCIVDLHALTTVEESHDLANNTRNVAAAYLASGIDPKHSAIFSQSHVAEHSELAWILGCLTPLGWLNRMTQFKDKAGKKTEHACLGLLAYPVLMAADILLYRASHVPVGEDQKQHLELARDIAGAFNRRYNQEFFQLPEPIILGTAAARVMSLRDGTVKMSKSDASDYSRINLMDSADVIALKIRKAKTDAEPLPAELKALEGRPEALNLITIFASLSDQNPTQTCQTYAGHSFASFKKDLTDLLIAKIAPIGEEMRRLLGDETYLDTILHTGASQAQKLASKHMQDLRAVLGLIPL
ncbi:MAG: tryptophan--tRNA ligase [Alphaproteobacteria bacterium]